MLSRIYSHSILGIDAYQVEIEVDLAAGMPYFNIVGLPDTAIKESRDRIKSAIKNSNLQFPTKKITMNLAPADVEKKGSSLDLPMAIGILAASGQINTTTVKEYSIVGELGLDGLLRRINGALPMAVGAKTSGKKGLILPKDNANEAAVVEGIEVIPVESLRQAVDFLNGGEIIKPHIIDIDKVFRQSRKYSDDFRDVKGQDHVKRALEVAAAGGHNVIMIGPPGSGKTMLAKRTSSILPDMTLLESIETTKIHSIAGLTQPTTSLIATRPFRYPHHTISDIALIGGGAYPRPGEVSLAHNGVLFLDEMLEFKRSVLEVMRQPLEDGIVNISRASMSLTFPARFLLIGAMNPCPCGNLTDPAKVCSCTPIQIQRYMSRVSSPLLDRIDLHIDVPAVKISELSKKESGDSSAEIRKRVNTARKVQLDRFKNHPHLFCNAHMSPKEIKTFCQIDTESTRTLESAIEKLGLSARAYDRILKVSRTIADIEGASNIHVHHLSEAIHYRNLDRNLWK